MSQLDQEARSAATGSREALELCLRSQFDDDDAVTAAQIVVGEGWRPPDEVAALQDEIERRAAENARLQDGVIKMVNALWSIYEQAQSVARKPSPA